MRRLLGLAVIATIPAALSAQTKQELAAAADVISAAEITRHVGVLAHDSMARGGTPSPGLERAAQYVADQFAKAGLLLAQENTGWIGRYQVLPQLDFVRSHVVFRAGGKTAAVDFLNGARLVNSQGPARRSPLKAVLVAGRHTPETLAQVDLENRLVLYVASTPGEADTVMYKTRNRLYGKAAGIVLLSALDSAEFARYQRVAQQRSGVLPRATGWMVSVRPETIAGLSDLLATVGVDIARLRADTAPVVRELPSLEIAIELQCDRAADDINEYAPNVVGVLEGTDPKLKSHYIAVVAHIDGSVAGTHDNAAGTAGLIALAKAFTQPGARPARSVLFLAASGGAKYLTGSDAFLASADWAVDFRKVFGDNALGNGFVDSDSDTSKSTDAASPTRRAKVAALRPAAAINLDRLGRTHGDSVVVDGVNDADFATRPAWAVTMHPELRLTTIDGPNSGTPTSDHYNFIRRSIPSLYFHSVLGDDSLAAAAPTSIDADWTAQVAKLAFYIAYDLANAPRAPRLTPEGRRTFLETNGR